MNVFERIALEVLEEQRNSRLTDTKFNIVDTKAVNNYVNKNFVNDFAQRIVKVCGYHADIFEGLGCPNDMDPTETKPSDYIKKMMMNTKDINDLYVVVTIENEKPALCYRNGKTPFIGSLSEAKALCSELEELDQDEEFDYYVCRLKNYSFVSHLI